MKCCADPSSSARALTDSPSPECRPPVSMLAVITSQPCSRSETRAYEVSRPPEKARTILRLLIVGSLRSGAQTLENRYVGLAAGDQVSRRQQVELAGRRLDRLLH